MADPFVGQISIFGFNFAPKDWAMCTGSILPVSQNSALFALLGNQFGGDGRTTFALPDFRGRAPIHPGELYPSGPTVLQGHNGGEEFVTLSLNQMAAHTHSFQAANVDATDSNIKADGTTVFANATDNFFSSSPSSLVQLAPQTSTDFGGNQSHENRQPMLALNFCIALQGAFPSRN